MTTDQLNKMRNTLVYLVNSVYDPSMTKLLKLLFFCEEYSVKRHCHSFFGLDFYAWQMGPVEKTTYLNLADLKKDNNNSASNLFHGVLEYFKNGRYDLLKSGASFDDGEFSDNDMKILEDVSSRFLAASAKEMINLTHNPGSLWYNTVSRVPGLMEQFDRKEVTDTDLILDFSEVLETKDKKEFYTYSREMDHFLSAL